MQLFIQSIVSYLLDHFLEVLGMILSTIFVLLAIKENVWCWLFGALGAICYIFVYYEYKFYAGMSLQFYYVVVSVYGWWNWKYGKKGDAKTGISVIIMKPKQWITLLIATAGVFLIYVYLLSAFTDSPIVIGDSFVTSVCIVATWMAAKKILENWALFILSDIVSIGLYIYKELYPTTLLFVVYVVMAIIGYLQWKKHIKRQDSV